MAATPAVAAPEIAAMVASQQSLLPAIPPPQQSLLPAIPPPAIQRSLLTTTRPRALFAALKTTRPRLSGLLLQLLSSPVEISPPRRVALPTRKIFFAISMVRNKAVAMVTIVHSVMRLLELL